MVKDMTKKKSYTWMLLLAMLLLHTVFIQPVSAEEVLKTSGKPSELEQGLIDALNSNTNNSSTEDVITDYFKTNKDKISESNAAKNGTVSGKNDTRTYQLKDGSNITFTNGGYFLIDKLEVNNNTIQAPEKKSEINSQSGVDPLYTPLLASSVSEYNMLGWKLFTVSTQGYFEYDHKSVQPYLEDSWYVRNMPFNLWQISNWEKGVHTISSNTAEVYGQANFHYGFESNGNGLIVQNYYVKVYLLCDQEGNYKAHYSVTKLKPKIKIGPLDVEF